MRQLSIWAILLCLAIPDFVSAQGGKPVTPVLPFDFLPVHKVDAKRQVLVIVITKQVPQLETKAITQTVNGKTVKREVTYTVYRTVTVFSEYGLKNYRLTNVQGKPLSAEAFLKQAQLSKMILRAKTPNGIPPVYMNLFHPRTLILEPRTRKKK